MGKFREQTNSSIHRNRCPQNDTFNPDKAQQFVQNRVAQALPRLPEDVQRLGVTTAKSSPTLNMGVNIVSPK